ncbi:MAG TPA: class I SAM-dependent methyltransferase [Vicinamibacteria bacterium]
MSQSPSPVPLKDEKTRARIEREIEHHRKISGHAEEIWNWDSPAGRRRADRRAELFVEHGGLRPGVKALELGCGTGVFLEKVARCGATLHGLDLSEDLLAQARTRMAGAANVQLDRGNAEAMSYPEGTFDAVYGSSVLHHLDLDASLRELHRVLKPGGRLVFAEPNLLNPQVVYMFKYGPAKERFGVSPDEMAFTRFRARAALAKAGFVDIQISPFDFLHPSTPPAWLDRMAALGRGLERIPLVREIAGSLLMRARRA